MGFNFPNAPSSGDTYTPPAGPTYTWDGVAWKAVVQGVPVTVYVSDSPPPQPAIGQLWWNSSNGTMSIWYADTNSAQWVQVSGAVSATPVAETRNRVVNPAIQSSQENASTEGSTASVAYYAADQWFGIAQIATTFATRDFATADGYRLRVRITTGKPSLAAADYWQIVQLIEGTRVADFWWGTASAKAAVLRFDAYSNVGGTFSVIIKNGASDRSFLAPFTVPAGGWQTFTVPIPGDTTGTWETDTTIGMRIGWGLAAGTTYGGGVAGWQAGNRMQITGNTNLAATANNNFYLRNVGLYLDPLSTGTAPAWEMPDEAEEFRACQRYWQQLMVSAQSPVAGTMSVGHTYQTTMRVAAAYTWASSGSPNLLTSSTLSPGSTHAWHQIVVSGAGGYQLTARANLNARM